MALMKCPECGKEISSLAKVCIHCGCPLHELEKSGEVRIKMPNNIAVGVIGVFSSRKAVVADEHGKVLWEGQHGENACFTIEQPTKIMIDLGGWASLIEGTVLPKKKYTLVQDLGMHWLATYRLSEVDVIDSD